MFWDLHRAPYFLCLHKHPGNSYTTSKSLVYVKADSLKATLNIFRISQWDIQFLKKNLLQILWLIFPTSDKPKMFHNKFNTCKLPKPFGHIWPVRFKNLFIIYICLVYWDNAQSSQQSVIVFNHDSLTLPVLLRLVQIHLIRQELVSSCLKLWNFLSVRKMFI